MRYRLTVGGAVGVPLTYMPMHCDDQFDLLGIDTSLTLDGKRSQIDGKQLFARIYIRRRS